MSSKPSKALLLPADYAQWLASLKSQISGARQRAVLSANREQIRLYHRIGSEILERQQRQGWGAKVIGRLSSDLQEAFPEMKGFSTSNLKYMRYFAEQWPTGLIGQQTADQLPWFHIVILLTKLSDPALKNPSASPSTNSSAPCPNPSTPICPPSKKSKPNSPSARWKMRKPSNQRPRTNPRGKREARHEDENPHEAAKARK